MIYALIVFLPLLGCLTTSFFKNFFTGGKAEICASAAVTSAAVLSWLVFFGIIFGFFDSTTRVLIASWMTSGALEVDWALRIDLLTAVMLVVVNSVSALVHWYSLGYMQHDLGRVRFFSYLSLFTFAMLTLVTSDNFVQMFFGWEGVGLASYLLIGFWYTRSSANAAAMKAFIVNRVGDFGFALGIFGVFYVFETVSFDALFAQLAELESFSHSGDVKNSPLSISFPGLTFLSESGTLTLICLLLFMGAMGKSAQFFLHTWLPDAMEGPTPVSALIHAATMVTAGVFMVARLSPLFSASQDAMSVVVVVGAVTSLFAATVALVQNDIKRVIAYSTCSQLGYMFAALGVGAFSVAIFHLFTHAFFKALLFLGAGSVIHALSGEQDMRKMGALKFKIPFTYGTMLIGTLALTGFPFLSGYFSKDAIIESLYAAHSPVAFLAFVLTSLAALLTSFYSWRLIFLTFHGVSRVSESVRSTIHESPPVMLFPLFVLAVGAVFSGAVFSPLFTGHHFADFWKDAIFTEKAELLMHAMHHVPDWVIWLPLVAMLSGFGLAWMMYLWRPKMPYRLSEQHSILYHFFLNKWYFDELYDLCFVRPVLWLGRVFWKEGDGRVIDRFGPDGVAMRVRGLARALSRAQTGYIYHYAFAMIIGLAVLMLFPIFFGRLW